MRDDADTAVLPVYYTFIQARCFWLLVACIVLFIPDGTMVRKVLRSAALPRSCGGVTRRCGWAARATGTSAFRCVRLFFFFFCLFCCYFGHRGLAMNTAPLHP